jgi:amino acid permease
VATIVAIAVIALIIFDVMGRTAYAYFMDLSLLTVFVVIEVAALITLRFRRAA